VEKPVAKLHGGVEPRGIGREDAALLLEIRREDGPPRQSLGIRRLGRGEGGGIGHCGKVGRKRPGRNPVRRRRGRAPF
jgi:hypothetical protein